MANRYPFPQRIILDRGTEFRNEFARMVKNDYGLTVLPITTCNPQANAILERIHQTLGNILKTYNIDNIATNQDPWSGVLSSSNVRPMRDISYYIASQPHATITA